MHHITALLLIMLLAALAWSDRERVAFEWSETSGSRRWIIGVALTIFFTFAIAFSVRGVVVEYFF